MAMTEQQKKEYQTVVLAALLHDIGKFFQRKYGAAKSDYNHSQLSDFFVSGLEDIGWEGIKKWFSDGEMELVRFIVAHHHENLLNGCDVDFPDPKRVMAEIVSEADNLSSGEREKEMDYAVRPLESILPRVSLGGPKKVDPFYYEYKTLGMESIFPKKEKDIDKNYQSHVESFIKEFKKLVKNENKPCFDTIYFLLKKYLWCIPSAYYGSKTDISLFDHAKTTSAIAAILYKHFHTNLGSLNRGMIKDRKEVRYSLIQGDISGIQKFIYNITAKGAASGLKGRSFYLQLLSDAAAKCVLWKLDLPVSNLLYSSGGKFIILAQVTEENFLEEIEDEVNRFIYEMFGSELYFAMGKHDFHGKQFLEDFSVLWQGASEATGIKKTNKFRRLIENNYNAFFSPQGRGGLSQFCAVCGRENETAPGKNDDRKCTVCSELEDLGKELRDFNFLVETFGKAEKANVNFKFGDFSASYTVAAKCPEKIADNQFLYRINNSNFLDLKCMGMRAGFKFYGGNSSPRDSAGNINTFDQLAAGSRGIKRLGIIRLDVDNLGKIFQKELPGELKTISRVTNLSGMLDVFFQGHINQIFSDTKDNVYIIYSGGDDLFIVGSWNVIADKALMIKEDFSRFAGGNPEITLSAGIALIPGKYPISRGADMAGEAETAAKLYREKKDAVSFLNKTVSWHDFRICREVTRVLEEISEGNKGIIGRLKHIYLLYKKNEDKILKSEVLTDEVRQKIHFNQWMWRMVYSLYRFAKENKDKKGLIEEVQSYLVTNIFKDQKTEAEAVSFSDIPARWAEFLMRNE